MATDNPSGPSVTPNDWTAAQRTQEKHAHPVTLSDASDEDLPGLSQPESLRIPSSAENILMQRVVDANGGGANDILLSKDTEVRQTPIFDPKSEDAFPALGAGPKPQVGNKVAPAWGQKKHTSVGNGHVNGNINGTNGNSPTSRGTSSRASTPTSSMTPDPMNVAGTSQSRGLSMPRMTIPGKHTERIRFSLSQLLPRHQLKKPLTDLIREINKRSKALVKYKPGPDGSYLFEATGPPEAARQALIDVAKEVGSTQSVRVPIPMSVRAHIIGKQGGVIQRIQKLTGAKVNVPKNEGFQSFGINGDDDSATIDVLIEGDAVSAESARKEIEAIVNERTSTVNMRLHNIPPEFFPFLAGPRSCHINSFERKGDVKVQVPHYYTWTHQPPAQPSVPGAAPQFNVDPNLNIRIAGDRLAAQEIRAEIEQSADHLRRCLTVSQLAINRGQHQFIVGEKGVLLHDLLAETGCAVIVPPSSDDTELLSIIGPRDRIELGLEKVMNLAASMQMASVDIARQHPKAPKGPQAHARAVTRYLQRRQAITQLEKQHSARIVLPYAVESPMTWEVYARDGKNTIRARSEIMNLINAYPPSRIRHVSADPFFHEHLQARVAQDVLDQYNVYLLLPEPKEDLLDVVLVYEGPAQSKDGLQLPMQRLTPNEIADFEESLDQAQAHISKILASHEELGALNIEIPQRMYGKVQKYISDLQQHRPPTDIPAQMIISQDGASNGLATISRNSPDSKASVHDVTLRGLQSAVDDLSKKIAAFIKTEKQNELDRGHMISFDFPAKFASYLIGKKGENLNQYRKEFDVVIRVDDGKVEITGLEAQAELAKSKILALGKKMENEVTYTLKINPQYHRDMIGAKGSLVTRLESRHHVRVQFPRSAPAGNDEKSFADGGSDVGGARNSRSSQAADHVIIKGPKEGADEAREELLNLLQWTKDNSHVSTVSVAKSQLPSLIGQGGREVDSLRLATGAQIDVPRHGDVPDSSGRIQIRIKGSKNQVDDAKRHLEQRAQEFDRSVTKSILVDKVHHKALIGGGGANIRAIVIDAGGPDDRQSLFRTVRFPRQDSNDNTIQVEGDQALVDRIVAAIENFVRQKDNLTSQVIEVAPEKHRLLIGRDGETRRRMETQFGVTIDIPRLAQQGAARSGVKLTGPPANVDRARAHIMTLVKDQGSERVEVPRHLHAAISDNGSFFRRLRRDHQVTVDHAGVQPPSKPAEPRFTRGHDPKSLPLITDEHELDKTYTWEVVDASDAEREEGEIPWVLRGPSAGVSKAREALEKAIKQVLAQEQSSTGYLVLPDVRSHRFIIGQGGSQINSIRQRTDCRIMVPRDQANGEAIEIVGSREKVEEAKNIILEIVQDSGKRASRD